MAMINQSSLSCGPGSTVFIKATGFDGKSPVAITVGNQIIAAVLGDPTLRSVTFFGEQVPNIENLPAISFVVPDGLMSGPATMTDGSLNSVALSLIVSSQYAQASDYIGEGADLDPISPVGSELDAILRRASGYVDAFIGGSVRLSNYVEQHRFKKSRRVYPFHSPISAVLSLSIVTSNTIRTVMNPSDVFVNAEGRYLEMLAYGFGNYALVGALETIGYAANVLELTLTAGYPIYAIPDPIRESTIMIASALIDQRRKRVIGLGGLAKLDKDSVESDGQPFAVPQDVKAMLRPYIVRSIR